MSATDIKLVDALTYKLEPGSKYLIFVNNKLIDMADASLLRRRLKELGMNGVVVLTSGDPRRAVIVEEKK